MAAGLSSIASAFFVVRATQYSRLATVSIIFFDHLTMFDQEVEHIWNGHWTFINALYLANRYYALAAAVLSLYVFFNSNLTDSVTGRLIPSRCIAFHQWEGWTGLIFSVFGQVILQARLYALYSLHRKRKLITVSMLAAFILCTSLCAWLMWKNILRSRDLATPIPGGTFCIASDPQGSLSIYAFWIPIIAFESLLCMLALLPAVQASLEGDVYFTKSGKLLRVLLRDSVIYFFVIASSAAACLIGARVAHGVYLDAPVGFSVAMTATVGSRLILNIRDARHGHQDYMMDSDGLPISNDMRVRLT